MVICSFHKLSRVYRIVYIPGQVHIQNQENIVHHHGEGSEDIVVDLVDKLTLSHMENQLHMARYSDEQYDSRPERKVDGDDDYIK